MSERIIEIARRGIHLKIRDGMLNVSDEERDESICLQDIMAVVFAENAISLTGSVLSELANNNIAVVICDAKYAPNGILSSLSSASVHNAQVLQASMKSPLKKHLWKELVKSKIRNQSAVLAKNTGSDANLKEMVPIVRSGDSTNIEARAASVFWKNLPFIEKRDRTLDDINIMFNYTYIVIYSIVARSLCATGLNPNLGICHHNKYNPFCLASDVLEPYRFLAEMAVCHARDSFDGKLTFPIKQKMLEYMFNTPFIINNRKARLAEGIELTASSLKKSIVSGKPCLKLPQMIKE